MKEKSTQVHIVEEADTLFYQKGFEHTSFADIAGAVRISRGNFYYHFKTKDDILNAVIEERLENTRQMLVRWEGENDNPVDRIRSFINILITNQDKIKKYGCPVGTLVTELAKLNHASLNEASGIFTLFREWLRHQFEQLGIGDASDRLAMHLLARSQGVATLTAAYQDCEFVQNEVMQMEGWLQNQLDTVKPTSGV